MTPAEGGAPAPAAPAPAARPSRAPAVGARAAHRAAQGAQHPGRAAQPPHEEAARNDPQRAAGELRRPADGDGEHRAARGAHRHPAQLALTVPGGRAPRRTRRPATDTRGRETARFPPRCGARVRPAGCRRRGQLPDWTSTSSSRSLSAWALRVVAAEQQLATGREYGPYLGGRSATVTAVGGGQLGPGQGSWLHSGLPPSRLRWRPGAASCDDRLRGAPTLPDVQHPCMCSRGASRRPSRRPRWPPLAGRGGCRRDLCRFS